MDINNIFKLFENDSKKIVSEVEEPKKGNIKDNPIYWLGMFKKTLDNKETLKNKLLLILKDNSGNIDKLVQILINNNAFNYIKQIDVNNLRHQEMLYTACTKNLLERVKQSKEFFSSIEEYEKCSHLQQIQSFLELLLF